MPYGMRTKGYLTKILFADSGKALDGKALEQSDILPLLISDPPPN